MEPLFKENNFFDPISKTYQRESEYLATVFQDEKERWLANMVTRYRHHHITWWDRCWGPNGGRYQGNWFGDYDEEKAKVNEQAKRQIIRKSLDYLLQHEIGIEVFQALQGTYTTKPFDLCRKKTLKNC
jgi:hypothetical protein